jgi:hypothetical protein
MRPPLAPVVGRVAGAVEDHRHLHLRHDVGREARREEVALGHEDVGVRADPVVVAAIAAVVAAVIADVDARRERRPADVVAAFLPGDPGGAPLVAGHPGPADLGVVVPAAVVVGGPAVGLVGDPGPPLVGPHPVAVLIGAPARGNGRGRPDPAVLRALDPVSVGGQVVVEESEVHRGPPRGADMDARVHRELSRRRRHGAGRQEQGKKRVARCLSHKSPHPLMFRALMIFGMVGPSRGPL